jgi:hypothetical protein
MAVSCSWLVYVSTLKERGGKKREEKGCLLVQLAFSFPSLSFCSFLFLFLSATVTLHYPFIRLTLCPVLKKKNEKRERIEKRRKDTYLFI